MQKKSLKKNFEGYEHNKTSWDGLLGLKIGNNDDAKVVLDCVVLSAIGGRLLLITLDVEHMLSKKKEIEKFVDDFCIIPSFNPDYDLLHINDVI